MPSPPDREGLQASDNPLGIEGIEFIEIATRRPQALGASLEQLGFRPVARHRSREVLRYRQGAMNLIVNAQAHPGEDEDAPPRIAAIALRVHDAAGAWRRVTGQGAWPVPAAIEPMELWIPGIHGVGNSRLYFVDRWREFSIYDVDFTPIPTVDPTVTPLCDFNWFGVVQYIGADRSADWLDFYESLFGFVALPDSQRFGILPRGTVLRSPCGSFFLQLIESAADDPAQLDERLQRIALATPDVEHAVGQLRARGIDLVELNAHIDRSKGALTRAPAGGISVELVHSATIRRQA